MPLDELVAHYEQAAGHPVNDLGWYTVWGAFRNAVVFMRLAQAEALAEVDGFPEDDNPATSLMEHVLDEVA
jgi:aminoglycoside phosphotransferase (APT) family kinase protein